MTNAFTRGLKRLFGAEPKAEGSCCSGCAQVKVEPIKLNLEDKALVVAKTPSKKTTVKAVKKVAKKPVKKPVAKKTVKKTVKKKVSKKTSK